MRSLEDAWIAGTMREEARFVPLDFTEQSPSLRPPVVHDVTVGWFDHGRSGWWRMAWCTCGEWESPLFRVGERDRVLEARDEHLASAA